MGGRDTGHTYPTKAEEAIIEQGRATMQSCKETAINWGGAGGSACLVRLVILLAFL